MADLCFDYRNNAVFLKAGIENIDAFKLSSFKDSEKPKIFLWVWYCYSNESPLKEMFEHERWEEAGNIVFPKRNDWKKYHEDNSVKALIDKYINLNFSSNERFLHGIELKIEEYLTFWKETKIDLDNHREIKDSLKGANDLLTLKEKYRKMVYNEAEEKNRGGAETTMFEDYN